MKKLYLTLLGILLVWFSSSVFANCNFEGSTFEQERKEAYFWACNEWIINEWHIDNAKLNQELSRIEMARMLNIFAMKLIWKEEDPSKDCKWYSDLNYNDSIIANRACRLWIMWIWINKFKPNDSVSRAEFGTVLSRILYWDTYNVANWKYYEKHLKALKDNGVITNSNPNLKERKWYVLLMLKRYIDSKQNIKEEVLYKSDGWYISRKWTDVTFSDKNDSITINKNIDNKEYPRYTYSDSLQWPCAPWYHIPSKDEALKLVNVWINIRWNNLPGVERNDNGISRTDYCNEVVCEAMWIYFLNDIWLPYSNTRTNYKILTRSINYDAIDDDNQKYNQIYLLYIDILDTINVTTNSKDAKWFIVCFKN